MIGVRLAVAAVLATLSTGAFGPARSSAQSVVIEPFEFVAQSAIVAADATLVIELDPPATMAPDAIVQVTSYPQVTSRAAIRSLIAGERPERLDQMQVAALDVPRADDGRLLLTIPVEQIDVLATHLQLRGPGIFPLTTEIVQAGGTSAAVVSFIEQAPVDEAGAPVVEAPPPTPIGITFVVAADAPPSLRRDGTTPVAALARDRVEHLTELLETAPVEVAAMVRPELVEALAASPEIGDVELVGRLRQALRDRHQLLSVPYLNVSPSWAVGANQVALFRRQLVRGEDVLSATLDGVETERAVWFATQPIDTAGLDLLRELDVRQVVSEAAFVDLPNGRGEGDGRLRSITLGSGDTLPALVTNAELDTRLRTRPANIAMHAHHLTAELVGLQLEAEAASGGRRPASRAVLFAASDVTTLDLPTVLAVMRSLTTARRLNVGDVRSVVATADRATSTREAELLQLPQPDLSGATDLSFAIGRLEAAVASTTSILPAGDPRPARWVRLVDALPSSNLDPTDRTGYVEQLDGEMGDVRSAVEFSDETGTISLGSKRSTIPVVVTNSADVPLRVLIRFSSSKLEFPEGDQVVTVDERLELTVPVVVKSSGRFRVTVQAFTADGAQELIGATPVTVQATVLTGLAQVVTAACLLILATWWWRHTRQSRRRRLVAAAESQANHPSQAGASEPIG